MEQEMIIHFGGGGGFSVDDGTICSSDGIRSFLHVLSMLLFPWKLILLIGAYGTCFIDAGKAQYAFICVSVIDSL